LSAPLTAAPNRPSLGAHLSASARRSSFNLRRSDLLGLSEPHSLAFGFRLPPAAFLFRCTRHPSLPSRPSVMAFNGAVAEPVNGTIGAKTFTSSWKYSAFSGCFDDPALCFFSCCCPCYQFAKNYVATTAQRGKTPDQAVDEDTGTLIGLCCLYATSCYCFGPICTESVISERFVAAHRLARLKRCLWLHRMLVHSEHGDTLVCSLSLFCLCFVLFSFLRASVCAAA
jgi:hypothetical protein